MKISTSHERVRKQVFHLEEADIRRFAEAAARASSMWVGCPVGCVERLQIEIGDDEDGKSYVDVTRIFTAMEQPQSEDAVDPVGERVTG